MGRLRRYLSAVLLLSFVIALTCESFSTCEAESLNYSFGLDGLNYYFGSDSTNYLYPDNRIVINVDDEGFATVSTRLHAKAYYPTGVGELIEIPVPYPPERVVVTKISLSNSAEPAYTVVKAKNQTNIQLRVQGSPREVYVEVTYVVKAVYNGSKLDIRLLLSSFTTEISINLMIDSKETWINPKSVELNPLASKDTYFLVNEEFLPFAMYLVLSNVNPKMIECSLETQAAPYSLEIIPYYAMTLSIVPTIAFLVITKIAQITSRQRRVGVVVLAYRNLYRRLGRFVLTILGVSIPAMLLVQMLIQDTLAQKMLGPETSKMEWYIAIILVISLVIGGFQVFNTVFSSVLERMRELGLMKAIGFNPFYIIKMVIVESTLIGLIAGLFGSLAAATLAIVSTQIFYGTSLPNTVFVQIVANTFGETSFNNPFLRNYVIATLLVIAITASLPYLCPTEYGTFDTFSIVISLFFFLLLLRPTDPFTVDRLVEIAPTLAQSILVGVLFTVVLSISAGSYVAYLAGKIEPSEAMSRA